MGEAGPGEAQSWEEINLELGNKHVKCRAQRPQYFYWGARDTCGSGFQQLSSWALPLASCWSAWPLLGRPRPTQVTPIHPSDSLG